MHEGTITQNTWIHLYLLLGMLMAIRMMPISNKSAFYKVTLRRSLLMSPKRIEVKDTGKMYLMGKIHPLKFFWTVHWHQPKVVHTLCEQIHRFFETLHKKWIFWIFAPKMMGKYFLIQSDTAVYLSEKIPQKEEDFLSYSFCLTNNGNFVILFPAIFLSVFDGLTVFYCNE